MIMYIDETENEEFFIVVGLIVDSEQAVLDAYRRFKKRINGFKIGHRAKSKLFTEFKSTMMDRNYQRIKIRMLEELTNIGCSVIFSYYNKKEPIMNQVLKQSVYITLLANIVGDLEQNVDIVFDGFGIQDFEENIINSTNKCPHVSNICSGDSQQIPGLQFVDNLCSTIRRHIAENEEDLFFDRISNYTKEV